MDTDNKKTVLEIAQQISHARENRPNYCEAYNALFSAYLTIKNAMETLQDIVTRENMYRMYEQVYQKRKHELDKIV